MNKSKNRKISITFKVTMWYSLILAIILFSGALFVTFASRKITTNYAQQRLVHTVEFASESIEQKSGNITLSETASSLCLAESVELALFDKNRELIFGGTTLRSAEIDFEHKTLQTIENNSGEFYIYDIMVQSPGNEAVWVRGVFAASALNGTVDANIDVFILALPLIFLLVILGGYLTTKLAFKPINSIIETANKINSGNDLEKRINLADSISPNDEIFQLSETFDLMFDRLQKSFESEKRFSANASHELQTPIAVIISQCEYLLSTDGISEETAEGLEKVLNQAKKMSALISELLLLSRGDDNRLMLSCDEFDLSETALMVCEDMGDLAARKDISIITDIEEHIKIEADQTLIMRLFINLISNAIKYGRNGGYVRVSLKTIGDVIRGEIEDNGVGISADDIGKIWERFYQVEKIKSSSGGYGLGLPLTKMIVDAHGGAISARSEYGKGSIFSFTLSRKTNS